MHTLTESDYDEILQAKNKLFCPDYTGIKKGDRLHLWAKVGGEMQLINVVASGEPYQRGKKSIYVDVFGYDFRGSVNVKKLRKVMA